MGGFSKTPNFDDNKRSPIGTMKIKPNHMPDQNGPIARDDQQGPAQTREVPQPPFNPAVERVRA